MTPNRDSALFILNLWELSDGELDTIKDLALQREATRSTCLSVWKCNSKADTSYHFNLKGPVLPLTENPQTLRLTRVHLLLLLCSSTAVNPAQSFITKAWGKKCFGDMLWALDPNWTKSPFWNPGWSSKPTEHLPIPDKVFPHPRHSRSPCWQFSCFWFNSKLPCPSHTFFRKSRHSAYDSFLRGQNLKS